nr:LCP family protein [Salsipaludibacter albus]
MVVLLVVVAWGAALAWHLDSSIQRVEVSGLTPRDGARVNLLVVGSDSRADLSDEERNQLTTGDAEGERTDSIMVLSVRGSEASLTAFPRDLWVTRCDGSEGRINAALGIDGPGCLVDTIEGLSDVPIHNWAEVDFGGFRELVDAVGGVEICVDTDLVDPLAGLDLAAGCQVLDGTQALGYVRTRKLDNDLERIKRQQEFLGALARRLATPRTVLDPVRAWQTTGAVGAALRADPGLGLVEFARLGWGGRSMAAGEVTTNTVPGTPTTINGAAVLEPDLVAAEELFAPLRTDAAPVGDASARPTVAMPDRSAIEVTVLNAGDVPGLAGTTADALSVLGYDVVEVGDTSDVATTTIVAGPDGEGAARRVAADLPVDPTMDTGGSFDGRTVTGDAVVLVLGGDLGADDLPAE